MTEQWRDIDGYLGKYQISNRGRVKSLARETETGRLLKERIMKAQKHSFGYRQISLQTMDKKQRFYIHRLVLIAFVSKPKDGLEANHKDGNKTNNLLENLEWVSRSYNHTHAYKVLGKQRQVGSKHGAAKLTEKDVLKMRRLFKNGITKKAIAKQFGVAYNTAQQIIIKRRWKHI